MGANKIIQLGAATANGDAANKFYVDTKVSDRRLKENINPVRADVLDRINKLEVIQYDTKEGVVSQREWQKQKYGLLADNVEMYFPDAVHHLSSDRGDDGESLTGEFYKGVDYSEMVPLLIKAIQELSQQPPK